MMTVSRELLEAYLDDALTDAESAQVEQCLRESAELRDQLSKVLADRDRGEHSIGAIWRRGRLTCPSREQLGSFLLGVLDPDLHDYIEFHLTWIGCPYCQANRDDLIKHHEPNRTARRRRYFQSSAGYLPK